jgi:hypothetical protein
MNGPQSAMAPSVSRAGRWWDRLGEILKDGQGPVTSGAQRDELVAEWEDVRRKERELDDCLFIGIVGGTGVGKSTLINALAAQVISRVGDRRPTTDRVVVYRHEDDALPERFPRDHLATPEKKHRAPTLERLVLLDFPDFDSVEADHARILELCLPHLDVTFIIVDETKYGDWKLYDLLGRLPYSSDNLHFVFNKVDELEARYGDRLGQVTTDLLEDLRAKLKVQPGLDVPRDGLLMLSALEALRQRQSNGASSADGSTNPSSYVTGDFERLVDVLEEYRSKKLRLQAKEVNVAHLKSELAARTRETFLASRPDDLVEMARRRIDDGLAEARTKLNHIRPEVLRGRERVGVRSAMLRRWRSRFGFPMDLMFLLLTEWRLRGRESKRLVEERLPERFRAHYAPVHETLPTFERSYRAEFGDDLGPRVPAGQSKPTASPDAPANSTGLQVTEAVEARLSSLTRWRRLKNHIMPLGALGLWVWSLVYPALEEIVERDTFQWTALFGEVASALFQALNPFQIFGLIFVMFFLYGLGAVVLWCRVAQAVEDATSDVEASYREEVERSIESLGDRLRNSLAEWKAEKQELEEIAQRIKD